MTILMPDLTVEFYNADHRVLSRIRWQEAVRLILRGRCMSSMCTAPAVHVRGPSLVIELPMSVAVRSAMQTNPAVGSAIRPYCVRIRMTGTGSVVRGR
jgi:hypothetical protein